MPLQYLLDDYVVPDSMPGFSRWRTGVDDN